MRKMGQSPGKAQTRKEKSPEKAQTRKEKSPGKAQTRKEKSLKFSSESEIEY
jgi:hypothetical protein